MVLNQASIRRSTILFFFFSSRRRHTRYWRDWSSDVCSSDLHRELYRIFSVGDVVVVELALQGTHKGPLPTPMGILPPTDKRMDAPCCDVFQIGRASCRERV